jgi:hypothetical protein
MLMKDRKFLHFRLTAEDLVFLLQSHGIMPQLPPDARVLEPLVSMGVAGDKFITLQIESDMLSDEHRYKGRARLFGLPCLAGHCGLEDFAEEKSC